MCKTNYIQYHFLATQQRICSQCSGSDGGTPNLWILQILQNSWKRPNSQTREDSNLWKWEKQIPSSPSQPPSISWAWRPWYGIFPWDSLGSLPGCAPSQLPPTCLLAEHLRLKKLLDFIATTESIRVISILLLLNPKHSSYQEEN